MKIGIIGAGKVGIAIASVLKAKGFEVAAIASRRQESLDTARRYVGDGTTYTLSVGEVVEGSDVIGVTVQDREIPALPAVIAEQFQRPCGKGILPHERRPHSGRAQAS